MNNEKKNTPPTWEELIELLNTAQSHPQDTGWGIYRYLHANVAQPATHYSPTQSHQEHPLSSTEARTLLASYVKLNLPVPSLLHSCILTVALKMAEAYDDFKLPSFLKLWGYEQNLRPEDKQAQTASNGRTYLALKEKVDRALASYLLHHPEEDTEGQGRSMTMLAVKVYETEKNGRRMRSVKLVSADGMELLVDSHLIPSKPWEIAGNLYDVLTRTSKEGNVRASEVVESKRNMTDVFPTVVGYVEKFDAGHGHYHVFDRLSRHFVAENPKIRPTEGSFVEFVPVIPKQDKFKSAIIIRNLGVKEGIEGIEEKNLEGFGLYDAYVKMVNREKGYFLYHITSPLVQTDEGTMAEEGFASLSIVPSSSVLAQGTPLRLLIYLKRGKDGAKHNHVARVIL